MQKHRVIVKGVAGAEFFDKAWINGVETTDHNVLNNFFDTFEELPDGSKINLRITLEYELPTSIT